MTELIRPSEILTEPEPFYEIHTDWCYGAVHRRGGKPYAGDLIDIATFSSSVIPDDPFRFQIGFIADGATMIKPFNEIPDEVKSIFKCVRNGKEYFLPDVYWAAVFKSITTGFKAMSNMELVEQFPEEFFQNGVLDYANELGFELWRSLFDYSWPRTLSVNERPEEIFAKELYGGLQVAVGKVLLRAFPLLIISNRATYPSGIASVIVRGKSEAMLGFGSATSGDISVCTTVKKFALLNDPSIVDEHDRLRVLLGGNQEDWATYRATFIGNMQGFDEKYTLSKQPSGQYFLSMTAFTDGFRIPGEEIEQAALLNSDPQRALKRVIDHKHSVKARGDDASHIEMHW
ncbi:hypothetical protein KBD81_04530 [Candidatus Woesebacteria bacterium]|nr:hypothetical protein [Candidatus Woesebacteria bacterium]